MTPTYQPKALTPEQLTALSQELKQALVALYGDRLDRLILYGSYARGDFHPESDVDFLVVLRDEQVQGGREISFMIDPVYDLTEKYDVLVMVKPSSTSKYESLDLFFYDQVRKDGIIL